MGNNRTLLLLILVLVGLGALYWLTSRSRSHLDESGGYRDLVDGPLSTNEVFGIEAYLGSNQDGGFQLVKRGDEWVMSSHHDAPANVNKIRTLLGNLESLRGEKRSDDESVLVDYALDDDNALHIIVRDESGNEMAHLLAGKRSGNGGFVREEGSNEALLASHNLLGDFGLWGEDRTDPARSTWLDLVAYTVPTGDVRSLDLKWAEGALVMNKEFAEPEPAPATDDTTGAEVPPPAPTEFEWRVTAPQNFLAVKTKADGILNSLANLRARDVVGRGVEEGYGLSADSDRIVVTMADESTSTLLFGTALPDDENQFYFQVEGDDLVWAMPSYLRTNLFKKSDELKPE